MTISPLLPPHVIRFSHRARRINLRVLPGKGLEVVLPAHADPSCVPEVLDRHRRWIETHLSRMPAGASPALLPQRMLLKGGREEVHIRIPSRPKQTENTEPPLRPPLTQPPPVPRELALRDGSREELLRRLRHWVREEARTWLGGMLEELAREHGFSFAAMNVRFQKSRWGSCSMKGSINLNACLLFLPERLVRYILLHELCHTRQMNHSPAFWKLIFALDPDALSKDKAMRGAWRFVPAWVQAGE